MSFNILYVEDENRDYDDFSDAIKEYNNNLGYNKLYVERVSSPDDILNVLGVHTDLILADVFYPGSESGEANEVDRLDDVILHVEQWSEKFNKRRKLPIIAYTGRSKKFFDTVLRRKKSLYDIWDKNTASPHYIVWRIGELSSDLSRLHCDKEMQKIIRKMEVGPSWHRHVKEMAVAYNSGLTEAEQIELAGHSLDAIGQSLGVWDVCSPMWETMTDWEFFSRAALPNVRGHARHVINVFWLGYYLLNHKLLSKFFIATWNKLLFKRDMMENVSQVDPVESINNVWFYASLFHDAGSCVEKTGKIIDFNKTMLNRFSGTIDINLSYNLTLQDKCNILFNENILNGLDTKFKEIIESKFKESISHSEIDHGVISALNLVNLIKEKKQTCYAKEAARAISSHNIIGKIENIQEHYISWDSEPFSCLLILCDQIQTWDRFRGDNEVPNKDQPVRAELLNLNVLECDGSAIVHIDINYIAPPHLCFARDIFDREKIKLEKVLRKYPFVALNRIDSVWPFKIAIKFYLDGERLEAEINF